MSVPGEPDQQEAVIGRLRELHDNADDEDRPRAALLLGLALTDRVAGLSGGDPRRRDLAAQGLSCLAESADTSPATATARQLLRGCLRATSPAEPVQEPSKPAVFSLDGGDLNWDIDWEAARGLSEAAKNLTSMLGFLASSRPSGDPLRQALTNIVEVMGAFERGQWSPEYDRSLEAAIAQVAASGLGTGVGVTLRTVAMFIRARRCQQVLREGGQPNWPSVAELDLLIADLLSDDELTGDLGPPFQGLDGMHNLLVVFVIAVRLQVSFQGRGVRRDAAWRDDILQMLDQADDHLRQLPSAYPGPVGTMRAKLAEARSALSRAQMASPAPTASPPSAAPPAPSPPSAPLPPSAPPPSSDPPRSAPPPSASADPANDGGSWPSAAAMSQISQPVLDGLKTLFGQSEGAVPTGISAMLEVFEAITSRRWSPALNDRLAELEREARRLEAQGEPSKERALVALILAMSHAARASQRSQSPRPADHPSASEVAAIVAEIESAMEVLAETAAARPDFAVTGLQAFLALLAAMQLVDLSWLDGQHRAGLLARAREYFGQIPPGMLDRFPVFKGLSVLEQLIEGRMSPDDEAVTPVIDLDPNVWDQSGSDLRKATASAARAQQSGTPEDLGAALGELHAVWMGLPAGSPSRAEVLIKIAAMQNVLAARHGYQRLALDAAATAITAVRAATVPDELRSAARLLVTALSLMLARREREGGFAEAAQTLGIALTSFPGDDWALRVTVMTAIGAAQALSAAVSGDEMLRSAAREAVAEAERSLPDPTPAEDWYVAAKVLCGWLTAYGLCLDDAESVRLALRLLGRLESVLDASPGLAPADRDSLRQWRQQLTAPPSQPAGEPASGNPLTAQEARRIADQEIARASVLLGLSEYEGHARWPLAATRRPDPAPLRAIVTALHRALEGAGGDIKLRERIDRMLGLCHAELYWAGGTEESVQTLRETVVHLNRALMASEHALPTVERAEMIDVVARCLREAAQRYGERTPFVTAERTARAALRELADCVLVAHSTGDAVEVAARANEIVTRVIGWCLADGHPQAAVGVAETGRGLVLGSVVLSGRAEEILASAGQRDAAAAWRADSEISRAAALTVLRETTAGHALLSSPIGEGISLSLTRTRFDAVIYLVPPAGPGFTGHALVVRPVSGQTETIPLPGLTGADTGTPLDAYLAALDSALAEHDPQAAGEGGFRAQPKGRAWADALDTVGRWAYDQLMAPLLAHVRGWSLGHLPRLALIPVGQLAAIPYAAAWTDGPADGDRHYAIDEVVISYAASARLLGEVARRPRQPLSERVVLFTDPTGEFPMIRRATRLLASRQYPAAEIYGPVPGRTGEATSEALLGAFPAGDHEGASLLQLSTHGTINPVPALCATDGWVALTRILERARDRAADAPGGLVITNACLTDSTRTHYDESLTLATALLAAGATAVIGTRWPVDDDTVAVLCLRLHYHLQVGCDPAQALRLAQLDLLRPTPGMRATLDPHLADTSDARFSHPATWAGHVHHGI